MYAMAPKGAIPSISVIGFKQVFFFFCLAKPAAGPYSHKSLAWLCRYVQFPFGG